MLLSPRQLLSVLFFSFCPWFSHTRCLRGGEGCFRLSQSAGGKGWHMLWGVRTDTDTDTDNKGNRHISLGQTQTQIDNTGNRHISWGQTQSGRWSTWWGRANNKFLHKRRQECEWNYIRAKVWGKKRKNNSMDCLYILLLRTWAALARRSHESWFVQLGHFARLCLNWGTMKSDTDDKWFLE